MSRRANCWANAVAESFLGTLKTELIQHRIFATRAAARTTIAEWIEVFYNRQCIHSTIGFVPPVQFEEEKRIIGSLLNKPLKPTVLFFWEG
ncbi:integrase core domain-containing protein [Thalassoporum mexicanum]|uniref:integrase core domain-containing protein n=1 Tax=Thalassoporum mexicanum TaxID=3457544 RepID=UPI000689112C